MKPAKIRLPSLGKLSAKVRWCKRVGDVVAEDDVLLELDFDGQRVPFRSPRAGRLDALGVEEGHDAHSDAVVAVIAAAAPDDEASSMDWVSVTCTFKCRMCGFFVPLGSIDTDGVVVCARCSLEQAFDVKAWDEALAFAHDVASTGNEKRAAKKHTVDTEALLTLEAKPHAPVCTTCGAPVTVAFDGGTATTTCATCKASVAYVVPPAARNFTHGSLCAVLASEHRSDHATVKVEETASAIAIQCPSCNAPLDAGSGTKIVVCKFCHVTSRIPDRVWLRLKGKEAAPEPIFLAFCGASPIAERRRAEAFGRALDSVRKAAEEKHEADRHRAAAERERAKAEEGARLAAEEDARAALGAAKKQKDTTRVVLVVMLVCMLGGALAVWLAVSS